MVNGGGIRLWFTSRSFSLERGLMDLLQLFRVGVPM